MSFVPYPNDPGLASGKPNNPGGSTPPPPPPAVPAFVQRVGQVGAAAVSAVIPVTVPTTAGNTLIVGARSSSGHPVTSVADTKGNTYELDAGSGTGVRVEVWSAPDAAPLSAGDSITVTFGLSSSIAAVCYEYSGILTANRVDQTATNFTGSVVSEVTGPTPATGFANEMAITMLGINTNATVPTPDAAWTLRDSGESSTGTPTGGIQMADRLLSVSGATPQVTWSFAVATSTATAIVTYRSV